MALFIPVEGGMREVSPRDGKAFTMGELWEYVGGYAEAVALKDKTIMYVNEDGLALGLSYNIVASKKAWDYIVGDVLVASLTESGDE